MGGSFLDLMMTVIGKAEAFISDIAICNIVAKTPVSGVCMGIAQA